MPRCASATSQAGYRHRNVEMWDADGLYSIQSYTEYRGQTIQARRFDLVLDTVRVSVWYGVPG